MRPADGGGRLESEGYNVGEIREAEQTTMRTDLVPLRWPEAWKDAAKLERLRGTPINCLVGDRPPEFPLGELRFLRLDPASPPEGVVLVEGVWPHVKMARRDPNAAETGPTGAPWVDSNGWRIRLAQALNPGKTVWLTYAPPSQDEVVPPAAFALAVAEAEAYGAHWVITLDENFRRGLDEGAREAAEAWNKIIAVLKLGADSAEWRNFEPVAPLAVISSFAGEAEFLSHEFLNLADRRGLAYAIIPSARALEARLDRYKAVIYIEPGLPEGPLRTRLFDFAAAGGLLILPAPPPKATPVETKFGHRIYRLGKGRVAAPVEEWADPYLMAGDVHLLIGHRHDPMRVWNGGMMNTLYLASPDGSRGVVHIVNYSLRSTLDAVTLGFPRPYQAATVLTAESSTPVQPVKRRLGIEFPLPAFSTYARIELRG